MRSMAVGCGRTETGWWRRHAQPVGGCTDPYCGSGWRERAPAMINIPSAPPLMTWDGLASRFGGVIAARATSGRGHLGDTWGQGAVSNPDPAAAASLAAPQMRVPT